MIEYAKSKGVKKTALNTNASLLTLERGQALGRAGLDEMRVSFDGDSPEENDAIRVGGHFHQSAPAVRALAMSHERPKTITIYNARHGKHNSPAKYLCDYFKDCIVDFRVESIREWARVENEPLPANGTRFCSNLFETFTVLSNGVVPMCCEDLQADDPQGNAFTESPLIIWEQMQSRRDAFAAGDYPRLCQSCWVVTKT